MSIDWNKPVEYVSAGAGSTVYPVVYSEIRPDGNREVVVRFPGGIEAMWVTEDNAHRFRNPRVKHAEKLYMVRLNTGGLEIYRSRYEAESRLREYRGSLREHVEEWEVT